MKIESLSAGFMFLCALGSVASPPQAYGSSETIKVYKPGRHVTMPELMPIDFSTSADPSCQGQLSGQAQFAVIVDPDGVPRNIFASRPIGNSLDTLAAEIAAKDHFRPGQKDGASVAVSITIDIQLEACTLSEIDAHGNATPKLKLRKQPVQQLGQPSNLEPENLPVADALFPSKKGGIITAPIPISTPEAKYTIEAKKKRIQGICLVSLIVDAYGVPQNPRVVKSIGYGLDEAALEAVKAYRFRPATKDGHPVAVLMSIEVNFRLQ